MQLEVLHDSIYSYEGQVETVRHLAHLKPPSSHSQKIIHSLLKIDPQPDLYYESQDVYQNFSSYFSIQEKHSKLIISAQSQVETFPIDMNKWNNFDHVQWEHVKEYFQYSTHHQWDSASEFLFHSTFIHCHHDFIDFARKAFTPQSSMLDACIRLMNMIYESLEYHASSTDINTPTRQALSQKKGVCQDFAHIFISCLRSLGLPAKYISGYLLTNPPPGKVRLIGSDASHAWASVYIPSLDLYNKLSPGIWCDFDPTNNRWGFESPGEDYIFLAQGRDYADVSPIRGVIKGGANHDLKVEVTVRPINTN
jgi:transglutaminase-like putative cysteine protease